MRALLVVFHLPKGSSTSDHQRFHRELYGRETSSWGGRYQYRLRGLLDGIPHVLLYRGVVLIREEHLPVLELFLRSYSAEYVWREAVPTEEDLRFLSADSE